ncbi:hypothetical protein ES703_112334 [subsurface metagenome]
MDDGRFMLQLGQDRLIFLFQIREGGVTLRVVGAFSHQQTDSLMKSRCVKQRIFKSDGSDSVQEGCPYSFRMPAHVDERHAGSVRSSSEIDFIVSKSQSDFVIVVRGHACGVFGQVVLLFQLLQTNPESVGPEKRVKIGLKIIIRSCQPAVEPVVPPCAALADQYYVTLFPDPGFGIAAVVATDICTRPAGEHEHRVWLDIESSGMEYHNIQMDHPSFLSLTVLEDGECSSGNLSPCFLILLGFQDHPGFEGFAVNRCDFRTRDLFFFLAGDQGDRS